jgi:cytochrome c553
MKKFLRCSTIVFGGGIGLLLLAGLVLYVIGTRRLAQVYPNIPVETIKIPTDSEAVTRGKHIASVWLCTKCHGEELSGELLESDPFLGTLPATNLTSGEGGIGKSYTDLDWIRAIRHGVKPNSQMEIAMYDYYTLSDQDLSDLIAYLKQIPPVDASYPAPRMGLLMPLGSAVGLYTPAAARIDHAAPRPADAVPGATAEYGKYLSVLCTECHGTSVGAKLETWTQEDFFRMMETGVLPNGEQLGAGMPLYGEMNEMELTALWLYYQSVSPKSQK